MLGIAQFGLNLAPLDVAYVPIAAVPLSPLGEVDSLYEIWRADGPMQTGNMGAVHYRFNEQLLFGCIALPEPHGEAAANSTLKATTTAAYAQIFATLEATGYGQLVRVWNYVSGINQPADAGERYWEFNSARYESFLAFHRPIAETVPAASALGTPGNSPLVIYFLANRTVAQMLENPRQVSAYRYPPQYGPRSPTFSRAALLAEGGGTLMISGTASIMGHRTMHANDVTGQTSETLENIRALVGAANRLNTEQRFTVEALSYKAYLRHSADLPTVASTLRAALGPVAPIAFLTAEVCRRGLLVEIEAVGFASGCR